MYADSPLQRVLPRAMALVLAFVLSGALHDLVMMAVRGSVTPLFTPWFFLLGSGVVLGRSVAMDFSSQPWLIRAGINLTYIFACLALTLTPRRVFSIPYLNPARADSPATKDYELWIRVP